jgi:hypothetical protein
MKFEAQIKRLTRRSTVSNDVEYELVLVTDQSLKELMNIQADELIKVDINE